MRQKPLILIVDDEENFREIFTAKLRAAGFDTEAAKNEAEAVQKSKELMPDLILMDIFMPPGPTGTDIALNIKQNPETKNLKVAFLTNLKDPWPALTGDHKNISKELGMEDFIEKTEELGDVAKKVQEILNRNNSAGLMPPPMLTPP
ncbi:MAG: response regulator [Candidatus Liptonbacteria bacterium]|nr:response regulator [Candidatus Liptonbacteria bacterium]